MREVVQALSNRAATSRKQGRGMHPMQLHAQYLGVQKQRHRQNLLVSIPGLGCTRRSRRHGVLAGSARRDIFPSSLTPAQPKAAASSLTSAKRPTGPILRQRFATRKALFLEGSGHDLPLARQPCQKNLDFRVAQVIRVLLGMKEYECRAPINICILGAPAVVQISNLLTQLIEPRRR